MMTQKELCIKPYGFLVANIKKITSFTKIIVKVGNHKNMKLVKNKPERVWPLEIQYKYNK